MSKKKIEQGFIKIRFFLYKISKKEISNLDYIIFNGIGDVIEYQNYNIKKNFI